MASSGAVVNAVRPQFRQYVSTLFAPTLKVAHSESVESYRLMLRAGLIRRSSNGIYSLLPLGVRALTKLEAVIDDELFRIGMRSGFLGCSS